MKKHFYSHIVETSTLTLELGGMDLSKVERMHLATLVEANLYHVILDAILSELSEEDKKIFLRHVADQRHDEIWNLLHSKVNNIEDKIKKAAEDLKTDLHKDIKEAKNK